MPEPKPLPPPPDVPDQLSDADEMERVLNEHLTSPSNTGDNPPPVPITRLPITERSDPALAEPADPIFSSNEQVLERVRQVTQLAFGEAVDLNSDPNNPNITASAFLELFRERSDIEISRFLEEFFKDYGVGPTLPGYLNDLLTMSILKPVSSNNAYRDKAQRITGLMDVYISIIKLYGFEDNEEEVMYINSADFLDDRLEINRQWQQLHYMIEDNVDLAAVKVVGLRANRVAREIAAALIQKNRNTPSGFPKSLRNSAGIKIDDSLASYVQYEASGIIASQSNPPPSDPFKAVMEITLEGGMFLGCFTDKNDNKNKFVFYLPKPVSSSSGPIDLVT